MRRAKCYGTLPSTAPSSPIRRSEGEPSGIWLKTEHQARLVALIGEAELGRTVLVERHERAPDALLVVQRERGLIAVDVYAHHLLAEMVVERKFGIALFHSKLGAQCAVGVEESKRPAAAFRGRAEQERRFAALVGEGEDRGSIGQDGELRAGRAVCVVEVEIRGLMLRYAELRAPLAGLIDEDEILRGNGGRRSRRASSDE